MMRVSPSFFHNALTIESNSLLKSVKSKTIKFVVLFLCCILKISGFVLRTSFFWGFLLFCNGFVGIHCSAASWQAFSKLWYDGLAWPSMLASWSTGYQFGKVSVSCLDTLFSIFRADQLRMGDFDDLVY